MPRPLRRLAAALAVVVAACGGAMGWWRLWMYHGWPGPPAFRRLVPGTADGEGSYDATFWEMVAVLLLVAAALAWALRGRSSRPSTGGRR